MATCGSDCGNGSGNSGGFGVNNNSNSNSNDGVGDDTSKMRQMRYSLSLANGCGGSKERSEFFIVKRTDGGWGGIQSQEEMSAFFSKNRTYVQLSCSRSVQILQNAFSVCMTEFVLGTDFHI